MDTLILVAVIVLLMITTAGVLRDIQASKTLTEGSAWCTIYECLRCGGISLDPFPCKACGFVVENLYSTDREKTGLYSGDHLIATSGCTHPLNLGKNVKLESI